MARSEVVGDVWTGPPNKTGLELVLPLSPMAMQTLARLPQIGDSGYVFTFDGKHAFANFSKAKAKLDRACGVTGWTLHDLRRTARSLMSRAGVSADIAERCLGHVMSGVRGTHDRHAYFDEKKRALEDLAGIIAKTIEAVDKPPRSASGGGKARAR